MLSFLLFSFLTGLFDNPMKTGSSKGKLSKSYSKVNVGPAIEASCRNLPLQIPLAV
jgi:hypothetical protein